MRRGKKDIRNTKPEINQLGNTLLLQKIQIIDLRNHKGGIEKREKERKKVNDNQQKKCMIVNSISMFQCYFTLSKQNHQNFCLTTRNQLWHSEQQYFEGGDGGITTPQRSVSVLTMSLCFKTLRFFPEKQFITYNQGVSQKMMFVTVFRTIGNL